MAGSSPLTFTNWSFTRPLSVVLTLSPSHTLQTEPIIAGVVSSVSRVPSSNKYFAISWGNHCWALDF